jgi:hypothetical protein
VNFIDDKYFSLQSKIRDSRIGIVQRINRLVTEMPSEFGVSRQLYRNLDFYTGMLA